MFNRIVVPLDGSTLAEAALPPAIEFARLSGATLHLVRVIDSGWTGYPVAMGVVVPEEAGEILAAEGDVATHYLVAMRDDLAATGIPITIELRRGRAADEIRESVADGDLLAIASHGRSGFSRLALGSVTEDITRHMHTPVLLCHARQSGSGIDAPSVVAGRVGEHGG